MQLFNCCVGDKEAFVQFDNIDIKNAGETSFTICDTPTKYKMISLDSLQLEKLDFIKIDVEGHELDVLKGATETIKNVIRSFGAKLGLMDTGIRCIAFCVFMDIPF